MCYYSNEISAFLIILIFKGIIFRSSKYRMETIPALKRLVGINLQICYNIFLLFSILWLLGKFFKLVDSTMYVPVYNVPVYNVPVYNVPVYNVHHTMYDEKRERNSTGVATGTV